MAINKTKADINALDSSLSELRSTRLHRIKELEYRLSQSQNQMTEWERELRELHISVESLEASVAAVKLVAVKEV